VCSRWTLEEKKWFLEGFKRYGKDWRKLSTVVKTRSVVQIRTHAQKVFKRSFGVIPASLLEDDMTASNPTSDALGTIFTDLSQQNSAHSGNSNDCVVTHDDPDTGPANLNGATEGNHHAPADVVILHDTAHYSPVHKQFPAFSLPPTLGSPTHSSSISNGHSATRIQHIMENINVDSLLDYDSSSESDGDGDGDGDSDDDGDGNGEDEGQVNGCGEGKGNGASEVEKVDSGHARNANIHNEEDDFTISSVGNADDDKGDGDRIGDAEERHPVIDAEDENDASKALMNIDGDADHDGTSTNGEDESLQKRIRTE
jgi:SHAQKYF class myb-like DNA-binding protein